MTDRPAFSITPARAKSDLASVRELFEEYARSLPVSLAYQDFAAEISDLPGRYATPDGELLLARTTNGIAVGCVGLRLHDPLGVCEMKRLFVRPEARSLGVGKSLIDAIVSSARERGYKAMLLDTLPTMAKAATIYERIGFERVPPYYSPTPEGTVFMRINL